MKKFINSVENVEEEMVQGLVKAYPQYLKKLEEAIHCAAKKRKVRSLWGGGGRDTSRAGFVGEGC